MRDSEMTEEITYQAARADLILWEGLELVERTLAGLVRLILGQEAEALEHLVQQYTGELAVDLEGT
jgi:hypothetical protein